MILCAYALYIESTVNNIIVLSFSYFLYIPFMKATRLAESIKSY